MDKRKSVIKTVYYKGGGFGLLSYREVLNFVRSALPTKIEYYVMPHRWQVVIVDIIIDTVVHYHCVPCGLSSTMSGYSPNLVKLF